MKTHQYLLTFIIPFMCGLAHAAPIESTFTYQGRLTENGLFANGHYDLRFKIYNPEPPFRSVTCFKTNVLVSEGVFTTAVSVSGLLVFGDACWLEIGVRPNGSTGDFTLLSPDQPLRATPYAIYALDAGNAWKLNGQDSTAYAPAAGSTEYAPASGSTHYVAKAGDTMTGGLILPGDGLRVGANQLVATGGKLGIGTPTPTTELEVAGTVKATAFTGNGAGLTGIPGVKSYSENGPFSLRPVASGSNAIAQGEQTQALGEGSVAGGGVGNVASHAFAAVGGGWSNRAGGLLFGRTTVAGGEENKAEGDWSTIGGGHGNRAAGALFGRATVGGGWANTAEADFSTIAGGSHGTVLGPYSTIGGGEENRAAGSLFGHATIPGGWLNNADADFASIGGGSHNVVLGGHGTISGGQSNVISRGQAPWSVIGGGLSNVVGGMFATIPGGSFNEATEWSSFAAGHRAKARHQGAFVWADGLDQDFASTAANEFAVRANGGVRITSPTGLNLDPANQPLITRGWDPFSSGDKKGLGRWGLFMEPYSLIAGIPAGDVGLRRFCISTYAPDGAWRPMLSVMSDGNIDLGSSLFVRPNGGVEMASSLFVHADGNVGIGTVAPKSKLDVVGNITITSPINGTTLIQLGEGLDYAEGFDISEEVRPSPGTVLVIDHTTPGKLAVARKAYDRTVAGIVAGAKGLGSAVRLAAGQFDCDVALAGRVYCNVDATYGSVSAGDLLTTSSTPGHAMLVKNSAKAQGAILGKAMEPLSEGRRGQILVLVTLQ